MSKKEKTPARKKFIKDWARTIARQCGVDIEKEPEATQAYIELSVSQCMDSALFHKDKLDVGYDDGYVLKEEDVEDRA